MVWCQIIRNSYDSLRVSVIVGVGQMAIRKVNVHFYVCQETGLTCRQSTLSKVCTRYYLPLFTHFNHCRQSHRVYCSGIWTSMNAHGERTRKRVTCLVCCSLARQSLVNYFLHKQLLRIHHKAMYLLKYVFCTLFCLLANLKYDIYL